MFGFPPNWETYAANCFQGEALDNTAAGGNISDTDSLRCRSKSKCIFKLLLVDKRMWDTLLLVGFMSNTC